MADKEILGINFNKILRMMSPNNFAMAFVSVFIPIYLLKLGYSFQMVMLWMIIQHISLLVSAFITVFISNRIGLVHLLHVRFILLLTYFSLLLFGLKGFPGLFYIIPILIGAEGAFYWMPLNILFVRNTEEGNMGNSMSRFFTIPKILAILSPVIGAFIAVHFGFTSLFSFAMILLFFVFIPILSLRSEKTEFIFSWERVIEIFRKNKRYFIPEVIDNIAEDAMVIWSIFIYFQLASTLQVGIIGTIVSCASLFFTLTLGKLTDNWDKHKLLKIGAILLSLMWVINFFIGESVPNQWIFYVATILVTLSLKVFLVPYSSLLFNQARKDDAQFIILREIPVVLGRVILYGTAILLYNKLPILFLLIGIMFIYFWFLDTKKLE
jgi:MFS family permease